MRPQAAMSHLAIPDLSEGTATRAVMARRLAQQLLETLLYEDASPQHVQRLTNAYRTAVPSFLDLRRSGVLNLRPPNDPMGSSANKEQDLDSMMADFNKLAEQELRGWPHWREDRY